MDDVVAVVAVSLNCRSFDVFVFMIVLLECMYRAQFVFFCIRFHLNSDVCAIAVREWWNIMEIGLRVSNSLGSVNSQNHDSEKIHLDRRRRNMPYSTGRTDTAWLRGWIQASEDVLAMLSTIAVFNDTWIGSFGKQVRCVFGFFYKIAQSIDAREKRECRLPSC